ncbi:hypothetical protein [Sulfitobacter sp. R18_1]|uniref:hypothetical protein n=1 Tax=Sulfitobacter sp. R18_1 TaxID=2821104 RepID=UPI001ADB940A|nr:hypothetical protein [Sulfitobacter sp. R18_1]MBO9428053.1 hypothetical protein [Sulfitobacter sp. R18_1]
MSDVTSQDDRSVRRIAGHLEKVLLDAADTPISTFELAQTLAEQALAAHEVSAEEAAKALLMVENMEVLDEKCRKHGLSAPKVFGLLREIRQDGLE